MDRRTDFRLLAGLGLRLQAACGAGGAQGAAVIPPNIVVVGAGALEAVVVVCFEGVACAGVGLLGLRDCRAAVVVAVIGGCPGLLALQEDCKQIGFYVCCNRSGGDGKYYTQEVDRNHCADTF